MEEDRRLEGFAVPKAAGAELDPLNLRVQTFGDGVRDAVCEIGKDVLEMGLQHPRHLDDRRES